MNITKTIPQANGRTIKITQDESPESPRDWDNVGTLTCFHGRYDLGDKKCPVKTAGLKSDDFTGWAGLAEYLKNTEDAVIILPVYLYDHSGLRVKVGSFQGLLSQGHAEFDSGQIGFIWVSRAKVIAEYGGKKLTKKSLAKAKAYLRGEIETYNQYLSGDVYGYIIEDADGKVLDSCWDCYGWDYCESEALAASAAIKTPTFTLLKICTTDGDRESYSYGIYEDFTPADVLDILKAEYPDDECEEIGEDDVDFPDLNRRVSVESHQVITKAEAATIKKLGIAA